MKNKDKKDWMSWVIGMTGGVLLWELFKPKTPTQLIEAATSATGNGKYPNLAAVSARIDALWKDYQAGKVGGAAALVEAQQLADAANSFSLQNGEDATVVYAQALDLQNSIQQSIIRQ